MVRELIRVSGYFSGEEDYIDLITVNRVRHDSSDKVLIHLVESDVNPIYYKVLGGQDGVRWETLIPETQILKGGSSYEAVSAPWLFVKVQHVKVTETVSEVLTADADAGQRDVEVADGSSFTVGQLVTISDEFGEEMGVIDSISGDVLTLEADLVNSYTVVDDGVVTEYHQGITSCVVTGNPRTGV